MLLILAVLVASVHSHTESTFQSDGCYRVFDNAALFCARPFQITTALSSDACKQSCRMQSSCASAAFERITQQCWMFSIGGAGAIGRRRKRHDDHFMTSQQQVFPQQQTSQQVFPQQQIVTSPVSNTRCTTIGPYIGSHQTTSYYQWNGQCSRDGSPTPQPWSSWSSWSQLTTPPPFQDNACPLGEEPHYVRVEGIDMETFATTREFSAGSVNECLAACDRDMLPSGGTIDCQSFTFHPNNRVCVLAADALPPNGDGTSVVVSATDYYERHCFDAANAQTCSKVFREEPQATLIGSRRKELRTATYASCIRMCIDAVDLYGFVCKSGMYYFTTEQDNCILNDQSASGNPSNLQNAASEISFVNYFETNCGGASRGGTGRSTTGRSGRIGTGTQQQLQG